MKQHESIGKEEIENCAFEGLEDNEEGIPYVMGNTLWAFYQFSVLIVLLSVLRARMVNTYHRIFKEADVQWKFFRFVMKYDLFGLGEARAISDILKSCFR